MPNSSRELSRRLQTRRQFIKRTGATTLAVAGVGAFGLPSPVRGAASGEAVAIVLDPADVIAGAPPVQWAADELRDAFTAQKVPANVYPSLAAAPNGSTIVVIAGGSSEAARQVLKSARITLDDAPESLALARGTIQNHNVTLAAGSDVRGAMYAVLELADRAQFSSRPVQMLKEVAPISEHPVNRIRSISRAFVSDVEDKPWYNDRDFWPPYLTMLAANRFNRFNLAFGIGYDFTTEIRDCYFHFAYPFLLTVPGYDVRATGVSDEERDRNLQMLRYISDETAKRGLNFQLGLWTHAYQWTQSPQANHLIEGLTPATHAPYCRDALRALLQACPSISGVTFRIHGESGVPEGNYDLWKTIFDGAVTCGRRVEIDMHAKGMDDGMVNTALGTGLPVNISPKYWAEHMGLPYMQGAIRPQEMPPPNPHNTGAFKLSSGARQFLRYGYGDLLTEDRKYGVLHRMWPGTQRFLLWGDPQMAAGYGRVSSFCGSNGIELFEPLFFKGRKGSGLPGGRDGYADLTLRAPGGDFEKYRYTYRVWGRNIYNPGDAEASRRFLDHQFGKGAEPIGAALAAASNILPLVTTAHCPSAANNTYWPEMYSNMPTHDARLSRLYGDTPSPHLLGTVSPLDPEFFMTIEENATELLTPSGKMHAAKYTPAWVAQQLEEYASVADANLKQARTNVSNPTSAEFRRLAADVQIQIGLGRFFAAKFKSGVLLAIYHPTGYRPALDEAIKASRAARAIWQEFAENAKGAYRTDVTYGFDANVRGHWLDRLRAMDDDIADLEKWSQTYPSIKPIADEKATQAAIKAVLSPAPRPDAARLAGFHTPPPNFRRSQAVIVTASFSSIRQAPKSATVHLRYRHVNQAETWQTMEMSLDNKTYRTEIPAAYADSPFPLQYYFGIVPQGTPAELFPALHPGWEGQPYFVLRQS